MYERSYTTRGGYKRTLWYPRFKCWDGKRRTFAGIADFNAAKDELTRLLEMNRRRENFDKKKEVSSQSLFWWIDHFLKVKAAKRSAERDITIARFLKEFFGDCQLSDIVHSKMLEYRNFRQVKPATINRELAFLRSVLHMAEHDGAIPRAPRVPMERDHSERTRTATVTEYQKIVTALGKTQPAVRDVVILLRETGFRVGEVLRLAPRHLDAAKWSIDMKEIREKEGLKRPLPQSQTVWRILAAYADGKDSNAPLFDFSRFVVQKQFQRACAELGIKGLWVHDLRATFATEKERQGWPRKLIMEYTGHRQETIFRRYSRPTDDDLMAFVGRHNGNGRNHRLKKAGQVVAFARKVK